MWGNYRYIAWVSKEQDSTSFVTNVGNLCVGKMIYSSQKSWSAKRWQEKITHVPNSGRYQIFKVKSQESRSTHCKWICIEVHLAFSGWYRDRNYLSWFANISDYHLGGERYGSLSSAGPWPRRWLIGVHCAKVNFFSVYLTARLYTRFSE